MVVYSVVTQMPGWYDWWTSIVSTGTPGPTAVTEVAAFAQRIILLLWFPLSYFVWRRYTWARWLVAYSSFALGFAQCGLYHSILRSYGSLDLVSEALVLAVPTFLFSALAFCPLVGQAFSDAQDHGTPSI